MACRPAEMVARVSHDALHATLHSIICNMIAASMRVSSKRDSVAMRNTDWPIYRGPVCVVAVLRNSLRGCRAWSAPRPRAPGTVLASMLGVKQAVYCHKETHREVGRRCYARRTTRAVNDNPSNVIVVGGGIAGMTVARAVADLGVGVTLVERDRRLGGHAANWACMATDECARCSACFVQDQISRMLAHPRIEVLLGVRLAECQGEAGAFRVALEPGPACDPLPLPWQERVLGRRRIVPCQAVVLATGFEPYDPAENPLLGYGHFDGVLTTADLDRILRLDDLAGFASDGDAPLRVAFIQCVGSRDRKSGREYCSQFCCRTTIRLVQRLKYLHPAIEATVFYIDLQIMSKEFGAFYDRVREEVRFIQGAPAEVSLGETPGSLRVYSVASGADRTEAFEFDRVVLAIGLVPTDSHRSLAELMGLDLNQFGYFAGAGPDAPLETSRPGVFLAGACSGPTDIQGSRRQAMAVAGLLAQTFGKESGHQAGSRTLWEAAAR